jgi:hypothetical protein
MRFTKRVLIIFLLVLCAGSIPLFGVGTTGTIVGTVKDNSGAVVATAIVTVRNQETNAARHVQTNESGDYTVPLLPPGNYEVVIESTGFRRTVFKDVALAVDQTVRLDASLQIGEISQQVNVAETAPLVQTDTSTIGQV